MEFCEKLQELRKSRGLTQEELAEALYVSRTAVSKWESGRGYPSIDSLKELSSYFSVTIDDLLSGEKLISIAQKENRSSLRKLCDTLVGVTDLFAILLIVLPLYPKTVDGYVYSVNLWNYAETSPLNQLVYWGLFVALVLVGAGKLMLMVMQGENRQKPITICSMTLGILTVLFLALAGETYAVAVAFLLLLIKGILLFRYVKNG
ncbi:MAG: helix-turn-helix transcriptional regulator [Clostridia bacterium]|nr:helix-turn-helix transcriptional regulator [Clostridia bacterium]